MKKAENRWLKRLFVIFVTLACLLAAAYDATSTNAAIINNALGVQTFRVEETDLGADFDAEYYKTEYKTAKEVKQAAATLCREVEAQGLVLLTNQNEALPLPAGAVEEKFMAYVGEACGKEYAAKLWNTLSRLETLEDTRPYLQELFTKFAHCE